MLIYYSDVTICAIASQIIAFSIVLLNRLRGPKIKRNIEARDTGSFSEGNLPAERWIPLWKDKKLKEFFHDKT